MTGSVELALLNVPQDLTKEGFTRKPPRLRSSIPLLEADVQRPSLAIVAGGAGPLHAPRVGHGVPLEGELAGGAAGELVEVQGRLPLHPSRFCCSVSSSSKARLTCSG